MSAITLSPIAAQDTSTSGSGSPSPIDIALKTISASPNSSPLLSSSNGSPSSSPSLAFKSLSLTTSSPEPTPSPSPTPSASPFPTPSASAAAGPAAAAAAGAGAAAAAAAATATVAAGAGAGAGAAAAVSASQSLPTPSFRVLFLDDQKINLRLTKAALEKHGLATVDICETSAEALAFVKGKKYDLILLDRSLGKTEPAETRLGYQVAKKMRALGITTPMYYFSTDAVTHTIPDEMAAAGIEGFIVKSTSKSHGDVAAIIDGLKKKPLR